MRGRGQHLGCGGVLTGRRGGWRRRVLEVLIDKKKVLHIHNMRNGIFISLTVSMTSAFVAWEILEA